MPPTNSYARVMANNTEDAMDEGTDWRTATFERKRPFDSATRDDSSNAGSAKLTSRKRARRMGKLGHQDVRDFVPGGANFSKTAGGLGESYHHQSENEDDEDYKGLKIEEDDESSDQDEENSAQEDDGAFTEGRRLYVGNLPEGATVEDVRDLFKGYHM